MKNRHNFPIAKGLHEPILFCGGEKSLVVWNGVLCLIILLKGVFWYVGVSFIIHRLICRASKNDPYFLEVYRRNRRFPKILKG